MRLRAIVSGRDVDKTAALKSVSLPPQDGRFQAATGGKRGAWGRKRDAWDEKAPQLHGSETSGVSYRAGASQPAI
jgi:hypothetical protein